MCGFAGLLVAAVVGCGGDNRPAAPDATDITPIPATLQIDVTGSQFDSVTVGATGPAARFVISNIGEAASGVLAATLEGAGASSYEIISNDCTAILAPGASCSVAVSLAPLEAGPKLASLSVSATPGGSVMASLEGSGVAPGALTVGSSTNTFGSVVVGQMGSTVATFTVTNTGGRASGALVMQPAGSDPANFVKTADQCAGVLLAPAASCTFDVSFAPLTAGVKSAVFEVIGNPGGAVSAAVNGRGLAPAQLVTTFAHQDFGSDVVDQTASETLVFTNRGDVSTTALTPMLTGSGTFSITGTCLDAVVAPRATCTVIVKFAPITPGSAEAQLTVAGSTVTLSGMGIVANELSISPTTRSSPATIVSQTSAAQIFTITNNSTTSSGTLVTSVGGSDPSQFQIVAGSDTCGGASIDAGLTCTISVTFAPTRGGPATATLVVASATDGAVTAGLSGLGSSPALLAIVPTSRSFGTAATDAPTSAQTFTVTNLGGQASGIPTATLAGLQSAQFMIAGTDCTAALEVGASCTVQVRFQPNTVGTSSATLTMAATPGGSASAPLTGEGVAPGQLVIIPSPFKFPTTSIGDTSAPRTFTVLNTGVATTGTIAISELGETGDYNATSDCTTLAANATCTITVTFTPAAAGERLASVHATATPGGTADSALSGTGQPRLEVIALDNGPVVAPLDFGTGVINSTTTSDAFITVRNNTSTSQPFTIAESYGAPAQYATIGTTCVSTIGGNGGLCTVRMRFQPTTIGTKLGSITFSIGAGAVNQATQSLTGVGTESLIITALDGTSFGSVPIHSTSTPLAFRVTSLAGSTTTGAITTSLTTGAGIQVDTDACTGQTLVAAGSCLVTLRFAPLTVGAVTATLGATAIPGGSPSIAVTATGIDPTGTAPTDLAVTPSSFPENSPTNTLVGTFSTTDADVSDTFTYSFVAGGVDNASFTITGSELRTNGVFDFETKSDFAIRVRSTDSGGQLFDKVLNVNITNVDEPPSAVNDVFTVAEDSGATALDILLNDIDIDGGPKTIASTTQPAHGIAVVTGGGTSVSYQPNADYFGSDAFTYTLHGGSVGAVSIVVTAVDDPPVAVIDTATVAEDGGATAIDVLSNDADIDGGPKTIIAVTQGAHGSVVITGGGAGLTYAPESNFAGADVFTYTLDGGSIGTVTMAVTAVDDLPVAIMDSATVVEDGGATAIDVLSNDTDIDGGPKKIIAVTQGAHGSVVITGGGAGLTYAPEANFTGADVFTYTLNGGAIGTVAVAVTAVDDPPVAIMDSATVAEDGGATAIDVLSNDTDIDGGPKTIIAVTQGAHGSVVITGGGAGLTYAPEANFTGADTFTYTLAGGSIGTVTVAVTAVDDPPVAIMDFTTVAEDSGATAIDVLSNDTDIDGGPKTIIAVTQSAHGSVVITSGGAGLTYAPEANFAGADIFTYTLNGGSIGTVTMAVTAVDDPPVAMMDSATVTEDSGATAVDVLGNDTDIDGGPKTIIAVTQGAHGSVVVIGGGAGLTYAPEANFNGSDSFTYTLDGGSIGTVEITVTAVDDPPVAVMDLATVEEDSGATAVDVLGNDTDIDGGSKTIGAVTQGANGAVVITGGGTGLTYAPSANFNGVDSFTYTLDGGSIGTVEVTVTAVDDPPVAVMDLATVAEDSGATAIDVLSNDTDVDGGPETIIAITQGGNGSVVITGGGAGLTYAPDANFAGFDSFTYTLNGGSIGTVAIAVTAVDDPPVAIMDSATVAEDSGATAVDVLSNDTDIDGGPKSIIAITQGAHGSVVITGGGAGLTYAPEANFNGSDSFTYTLDGGSVGTVGITVTAVDDLPIATDATVTVLESSEATTFNLVALAIDIDGGPAAAISSITPSLPVRGNLSITMDNAGVTYTPDPGFFGTYGFSYTLDSGSTGIVTIIVRPLNTLVGTNTDPAGGVEAYQGTNTISIDPNNPLHVITASNTFYKDPSSACQSPTGGTANTYGTIALFGSTDGGANWTYNCAPWPAAVSGGVPGATSWYGSSPTVTWDNQGRAYASYMLMSATASAWGAAIVVARSSDSGASWQNLGTVVNGIASTTQGNDKPMMTIDNTSGQAFSHPARVYVIWQAANTEKIAFSDDGTAWTTVNFPSNTGAGGGNVVVGADGTVYAIWNRYNVETVVFSKSTDGGATWTAPQVIATLALQSYGANNTPPAQDKRGVNGFGAIDVDRNPASQYFGSLYVSFSDFPSGTTTGPDLNVYVVRSTNGGTSWSSRVKVNDDSFGATQMLPWLAVDQSDGTVNVSWYDTRIDPLNRKTQVYYARSSDGGVSFEPNVLVSTADSAWTNGINYSDENSADNTSYNGNQFGDYSGVAASNRQVHPSWTDSRMFFPVADTRSPTRREDSATATITNCSAPSAITSPVVSSSTAGGVAISWAAPNQWGAKATDGTYAVFRDTTPVFSSGSPLASDLTATTYVDTTGVDGTTYYYFVRAKNNCPGTALTPMSSDSLASAEVVFGSSGTATGTLQGTVMAGVTPVSGVLVTAGTLSARTDGSGVYQFVGIGAGSYTVSVSPTGYSAASVTGVIVSDGGTTIQNLALSGVPAASCFTDTTYANFSTSAGTNVDIAGAPGDVSLTNLGFERSDQASNPAALSTTNNLSATVWTGQTFRAGVTGNLTKLTVGLGLASGTSGTITVEIRNLNGINPGTTVLATSTFGPVTNVGSAAQYTTTFATPAALVSGTSYSIVLRTSVGNTVFGVRGSTAGGSTLANGQVFTTTTSGTTWTAVAADLYFTAYVTPPLTYSVSGELSSSVRDASSVAGVVPQWSTLSWTGTTPANTAIKFQAAASDNISGPFNFVGPDGTASTFFTSSGSLSQFNGSRYLKYKALLSTTDNVVTPTLNAATVCFDNVAP
jgi:hypothetical protein